MKRVTGIGGVFFKCKDPKAVKKEGVTILDNIETYDYGKFVHILDAEGTKVQLWEAVD